MRGWEVWPALALLCLQNKLLRSNCIPYVVTVIKEKMFKDMLAFQPSEQVGCRLVSRSLELLLHGHTFGSVALSRSGDGTGIWGHILASALMIRNCDFPPTWRCRTHLLLVSILTERDEWGLGQTLLLHRSV